MPEERVAFEAGDGLVLAGVRRTPDGPPRAGVILAHGILTHKDYADFYPGLARALAQRGFESLRFDFRGHGESEGRLEEMTIAGEVRDLEAAVRLLRKRVGEPVAVAGIGFGAGVAVLHAAQARHRPLALVLLSSILDFRRGFLEPETPWARKWFTPAALEAARAEGFLALDDVRLGADLLREFEALHPAEALRDLDLPTLVVHGKGDPVASYGAARDAAKGCANVKFVTIDEGRHYFEGAEDRVFRRVADWVAAQAPPSGPSPGRNV